MSLPIKKAVFNIITSILTMGGYCYYVFGIHGEENLQRIEDIQFWGEFTLVMIGVTIVLKIILHIIFVIFLKVQDEDTDVEFMDERDKLIEMKSDRNGNYFFVIGLICSMIPIAMGEPVYMMFIILLSGGFVGGTLGDVWKIYYYNKGI